MQDLVIRGAVVIDGLGNEPVSADVAVKAGRITMVGETGEDSLQTIDANGLTLAPGIVDLHTHYDAQITWDATLSPSPSLGVTSAVMGNCGFGIVPSPPPVRDLILRNLSVVEGMNLDSLRAGVRWKFEEFSDYRHFATSVRISMLLYWLGILSSVPRSWARMLPCGNRPHFKNSNSWAKWSPRQWPAVQLVLRVPIP